MAPTVTGKAGQGGLSVISESEDWKDALTLLCALLDCFY